MKPDKVGLSKAEQLRKLDQANLRRSALQMAIDEAKPDMEAFMTPADARKRPSQRQKGVKGVRGGPKPQKARIGRPPSLTKADHDAVRAASPELLAVALRYYLKHAARNLKQKA